MRTSYKESGFTIIELLVATGVIAILAAIIVVNYNGLQQRAAIASITADLNNASKQFDQYRVNNGTYPLTIPAGTTTSSGNILQATSTGDPNVYCINGYNSTGTVKMSWNSSTGGYQTGLCNGATIGTAVGGTVPIAIRNANQSPNFSRWTLSGGAAYNSATGILTLGTTGGAISPLIRVDTPTTINTGGDFYTSVASPYATFQPNGGMHSGIYYYGSDGVTAVTNSASYTSNGCAQSVPLNAWKNADTRCVYNGGPNVIYVKFSLTGSSGGYASSDLQIRNPLTIPK